MFEIHGSMAECLLLITPRVVAQTVLTAQCHVNIWFILSTFDANFAEIVYIL